MRIRHTLAVAVVVAGSFVLRPAPLAQGNAALSGVVSSQEEGGMEGVVVNARRSGAAVTVSVVSDAQGRYEFPRTHLQPGTYALTIRGTGYDLSAPASATVAAGKPATADLKLQKTKDLASQLSSTEWAMSIPGTPEQKDAVAFGCTYCHTIERIVKSRHTAVQWVPVLTRMQTYFLDGTAVHGDRGRFKKNDPEAVANAEKNPNSLGVTKAAAGEYLASINMSGGRTSLPYELKTLPRPKGAATRVIMTQWDIPRKDTVAHDLAVDAKGRPWYNDQSAMFVGMLDPKTDAFTEYPLPPLPAGRAGGISDMEFDLDGNLWFPITRAEGHCHFGTPAKFEPATKKLTLVEVPNPDDVFGTQNPCGLQFLGRGPDGRIWMNNTQVMVRIDPKTAKIDGTYAFGRAPNNPPGRRVGYQIVLDSKGNPFISDFGGTSQVIGVDAATGAVSFWPTPTKGVQARRGQMDKQDRYWFAQYRGNQIAMFDTRAKTFREWPVPHKYTSPYTSSAPDSKGRVYVSSNMSERLLRLDPATSEIIEYLIPTAFDSKKILHDPTTQRTTLWLNNKRTARVLRVEPLD